ncbi:hypothetical protein [Carnobacterium funditum]|uniref:hypothetical protein n=1 Tax=Carnobacterium funditum TaxID=2752 RepID=UPI0005520C5D|nr:hypothetical protein [Carnobacterium funditum]
MRKSKLLYLTMQQLLFLMYFLISYFIYTVAVKQGNEGVTIQILGGKDDGFFYWEQVKNIVSGDTAILTSIYPLMIGTVVKITGIEDIYIIRLFNYIGFIGFVFVSTWIVDVVFNYSNKSMEDTLNERSNSKTILIVSFIGYTSLLMYATFSIYRDIWIMFFYLLSVFLSTLIVFNPKKKYPLVFLLIPSLWILGELRFYAVGSFILTLILYYAYKKIKNVKRPLLIIGIFLILFILYYTFLMDYQIPYLKMSLGDALDYRTSASTTFSGGSQMYIDLKKKFFGTFFVNYVHSYLSNFIGPLPWQINGFSTLLLFIIESIPMFFILRFLWIKRTILTSIHNYLLIHAFVWFGLIGLSNDNTGTAARLRMIGWVLIIIVFATVYSADKRNKEREFAQKN